MRGFVSCNNSLGATRRRTFRDDSSNDLWDSLKSLDDLLTLVPELTQGSTVVQKYLVTLKAAKALQSVIQHSRQLERS